MAANNTQIKKDYFWNTLGSVMSALASVLLLMIVTQVLGAYEGGIFALAFAVAQQFQTLGQYEMSHIRRPTSKANTHSGYTMRRA